MSRKNAKLTVLCCLSLQISPLYHILVLPGICEGIGATDSSKAALMRQGMKEMSLFAQEFDTGNSFEVPLLAAIAHSCGDCCVIIDLNSHLSTARWRAVMAMRICSSFSVAWLFSEIYTLLFLHYHYCCFSNTSAGDNVPVVRHRGPDHHLPQRPQQSLRGRVCA
jgi:hypothetical protein